MTTLAPSLANSHFGGVGVYMQWMMIAARFENPARTFETGSVQLTFRGQFGWALANVGISWPDSFPATTSVVHNLHLQACSGSISYSIVFHGLIPKTAERRDASRE